jgi:hypothetical protein
MNLLLHTKSVHTKSVHQVIYENIIIFVYLFFEKYFDIFCVYEKLLIDNR